MCGVLKSLHSSNKQLFSLYHHFGLLCLAPLCPTFRLRSILLLLLLPHRLVSSFFSQVFRLLYNIYEARSRDMRQPFQTAVCFSLNEISYLQQLRMHLEVVSWPLSTDHLRWVWAEKIKWREERIPLMVHNPERFEGDTNGPATIDFSAIRPVSDSQRIQQLSINLLKLLPVQWVCLKYMLKSQWLFLRGTKRFIWLH